MYEQDERRHSRGERERALGLGGPWKTVTRVPARNGVSFVVTIGLFYC